MKRVLLLAHPAGHSVSPAMHDAAFRALGIDARYTAVDVPSADLPAVLASLRAPDVLGANVTIPHKEAALRWMDVLTEAARSVRAVNTVTPTAGGLEGDNTDAAGFLAALAEIRVQPAGLRAVVLGAGGAARAVVYALARSGASVALFNRTRARAERLAADLAGAGIVRVLAADGLKPEVTDCDVLVNATSVGMEGGGAAGTAALPPGVLPRAGAVVDLVYRPAETELLRGARARGLTVQNGLPMLVHQGAAAFERWTGRRPPLEVMRAAALRALAGLDG